MCFRPADSNVTDKTCECGAINGGTAEKCWKCGKDLSGGAAAPSAPAAPSNPSAPGTPSVPGAPKPPTA